MYNVISENSNKDVIIIGDYNARITDRQVIEDLVIEDLVLNSLSVKGV